MPDWTGSFGSSGSPEIGLTISGLAGPGTQFTAVIDTGFTGFISMPLVEAFPLGLLLFGTVSLVLADGSKSFRLTAFGTITVEGESRHGVIVLEPGSSDVLLGMEFLRKFGRVLAVSPSEDFVYLYEPPPPAVVVVEEAAAPAEAPHVEPAPDAPAPPVAN